MPFEASQFDRYPPEGRRLAVENLPLLRAIPVPFALLLLQQIQEYDWRFPAERRDISAQLLYLGRLTPEGRRRILQGFERLSISADLTQSHWSKTPGEYSELLSSFLWATHQMDAFREASAAYLSSYQKSLENSGSNARRLGMAIIGRGVEKDNYPLFRKLRRHGVHFTNVNPLNGLQILLEAVATRSVSHPEAFAHWYIDGGPPEQFTISKGAPVTISYEQLKPARRALLARIDREIRGGIPGPEALLTLLHKLQPEDVGLPGAAGQSVLSHFMMSLLAAGSGTQIFSTTFVQWTVRELWRRAQPLTVLARFAPRQRERPMNELLAGELDAPELDAAGSLIDADMGAFYMWLDQQRLPGAQTSSFLAWFEGHNQALVISPDLPANTQSDQSVDLRWLIQQVDH